MIDHRVKIQPAGDVFRQRRADQASPMGRHKIHHFRRGMLSQRYEISFVFSVFIIDNNDDFTFFSASNASSIG